MPQTDSPVTMRRYDRPPADLPMNAFAESHKLIAGETNHGLHQGVMPKLQPSYSTPDIPSMRHNTGNMIRGAALDRHRREQSNGMDGVLPVSKLTCLFQE